MSIQWEVMEKGHGCNIEPSIAWVGFGSAHSVEEHRANARLIAAAPELLAALQAEERAQWAIRNLEAFGADPLRENRLAAKREVERTRSDANFLRKQAIAKAEGGKP